MNRSGSARPLDVDVVVPARNAEATIGSLIAAIPSRAVRAVVVVDNGSSDRTVRVAEDAGAIVIRERRVGYGAACLRGVAHLSTLPRPPDVVVFCPADGAYDPGEMPNLVLPLRESLFDLVIGTRALSETALAWRLKTRNFVAINLIRAIYGHRYTDLTPFRAIRYPALIALGMRDVGQGWLVEMQVKALKVGLRISEVPVSYRPASAARPPLGEQLKDSIGAGSRAMYQIIRHATAR